MRATCRLDRDRARFESHEGRAGADHVCRWCRTSRIKHVIYIIKENRTYDQILGDLEQNGKPVGNGEAKWAMYGEAVTPNEHKLALQFGVLDNFYDSGEVSGDGHVWSTAAIGTDYLEKTWQQNYRGYERPYDYEGVVADGYPLLQKIPDVNAPASGYLWGDLAAHGKTYYHFGEFISSTFCGQGAVADPTLGPMLAGAEMCAQSHCARRTAACGVGRRREQVAVADSAARRQHRHEAGARGPLRARVAGLQSDGSGPDQGDIFLRHLKQWVADREQGKDTMPDFVMLRLPNDHTAGTRPGGPTPKSSVADNDLAVGRAVEAISHSPYWDDTAFFILEDDAQAGADQWMRTAASRSSSASIRRAGRMGTICRQPFLLDRKRGAHHGGAAGPAADEQQRRILLDDFFAVHRSRRSAAIYGGLLQ